MDIFKQRAELSELVDVIDFDIAPAITNKGDHYTTHLMKGKKYPATLNDLKLLETMMKDIFKLWFGKAFDSIISYYPDNKLTKGNKEFYVIQGEIRVKK